ncbi:hypothetical protein EPI10_020924 [Gossypium australe]|uniref:Uncharacterized protein n=1 Tax=Gossypium australe TaxID=47621 RepID=A0A5B6WFA7_9ROSI|nr:hypothetical protein EPI10_020924 [Gossypium australe]
MLSYETRSPLSSKWMMNPYVRREKYSKSYYEDALTMRFHIASNSRYFIMVSTYTHGALPSDTKNPTNLGKEHCKVVALQSGKTLEPMVVEVEDEPAKEEDNQ